jgi:hypothetical protein
MKLAAFAVVFTPRRLVGYLGGFEGCFGFGFFVLFIVSFLFPVANQPIENAQHKSRCRSYEVHQHEHAYLL